MAEIRCDKADSITSRVAAACGFAADPASAAIRAERPPEARRARPRLRHPPAQIIACSAPAERHAAPLAHVRCTAATGARSDPQFSHMAPGRNARASASRSPATISAPQVTDHRASSSQSAGQRLSLAPVRRRMPASRPFGRRTLPPACCDGLRRLCADAPPISSLCLFAVRRVDLRRCPRSMNADLPAGRAEAQAMSPLPGRCAGPLLDAVVGGTESAKSLARAAASQKHSGRAEQEHQLRRSTGHEPLHPLDAMRTDRWCALAVLAARARISMPPPPCGWARMLEVPPLGKYNRTPGCPSARGRGSARGCRACPHRC